MEVTYGNMSLKRR